tara:strand:- start:1324 stop:1494 length:171 start_codon:yes stop_codon:yes gene_type:complete
MEGELHGEEGKPETPQISIKLGSTPVSVAEGSTNNHILFFPFQGKILSQSRTYILV